MIENDKIEAIANAARAQIIDTFDGAPPCVLDSMTSVDVEFSCGATPITVKIEIINTDEVI